MQSFTIDTFFLHLMIVVIGTILTFIGSEVIDETTESIEENKASTFAQKMEYLYREKRTVWYLLGFGFITIGWTLLVIGAYGFCQLLLLKYPNLVLESTIPWIYSILVGILILWGKVKLLSRISTTA
ncbi:MAG: hypothetical protein P1Q69_12310 [Candidatus Thorarchaeota archaeon]|nr:hypothetical protein [Candidatus Thorarchaeota archaeon]